MASSDSTEKNPLNRLGQLYAERFPDAGKPSAETDRTLLQTGQITENELADLYSKAWNVPLPDEEELHQPEPYPGASPEFFNANAALPYEWDDDTITFLVCEPYHLHQLAFLVRRTWGKKSAFRFVRRAFLERLLSKFQSSEEDSRAESHISPAWEPSSLPAFLASPQRPRRRSLKER